jgi:flagellar protein FlaG
MDVSNVNTAHPAAASVVKTTGTSGPGKSTAQGNSLPVAGQAGVRTGKSQTDKPQSAPQPNAAELRELVGQANSTLQARFSDLKFTVAEGTDINVVRIEDSETGELIRQIPSEAMLAIARALDEVKQGMMLEEKA